MTDEVDFNPRVPPPGSWQPLTEGQGPVPPRRRPWRVVYWVTFGLLCAAIAGLIVGFFMTFGITRVPSSGMAPTIQPGGLVDYQRGASGIVRGDVVRVQAPSGLLVRRVIGLPGDRVTCCDPADRVDVDGKALVEGYLSPGAAPSQVKFAVTLSPGHVWVMGDNRAIALDSRIWGPLTMRDISGRVIQVSAPRGWTLLRTPETFTADGLAPTDHRYLPLPFLLLGLTLVAILTVIAQGTAGTIRWAVRRRRRNLRQQPPQTPW